MVPLRLFIGMKSLVFYSLGSLVLLVGALLAGCISPRDTRLYVMEYQITTHQSDGGSSAAADRQTVLRLLQSLANELELREKKSFKTGGNFFFSSHDGSQLFSLEAWQGEGEIVIQLTDLSTAARPSHRLDRSRDYLGESLNRYFGSNVRITNYGVPRRPATEAKP
jgi:hypothetical protein